MFLVIGAFSVILHLTRPAFCFYNAGMKSILLSLAVLVILGACGVKTDLTHPGDTFPRNYPVY